MTDMVAVRRGGTKAYSAPEVRIGRSQFNESFGRKMTFEASYLYPLHKPIEVLPGDTWTSQITALIRVFSPLDAPLMDNISVETFWFFVPTRLLWNRWEDMHGKHDEAGAQDTVYTVPVLDTGLVVDHSHPGNYDVDELAAAFGLPHGLDSSAISISSLPFRAYNFIYDEWFRDQNLINKADHYYTSAGPDGPSAFPLRKSAKKHDYFTSCLPYLQKGTASAAALTDTVNVKVAGGSGINPSVYAVGASQYRRLDSDATNVDISTTVDSNPDYQLYVDLSDSVGVDINALRQAVAIQRLLERDARGGTRYTELIKAHFGVTSPDFRLQRPEYLGGGKGFINVSPVANTSGVDATVSVSGADEAQGQLYGVGAGVLRGHGWAKSFTEHGYIIGLIRARGDLTYFQGVEKLWTRSSRYDFYIPALAHLGEQSVLNQEIWLSNSAGTDQATFGYQARWEEYRQQRSEIVGKFNPDVSGALSHWHLAEDFAALPSLNGTFVQDNTPIDRALVSTSEPDFTMDAWFDMKAARPIPVTSIPSLTDLRF